MAEGTNTIDSLPIVRVPWQLLWSNWSRIGRQVTHDRTLLFDEGLGSQSIVPLKAKLLIVQLFARIPGASGLLTPQGAIVLTTTTVLTDKTIVNAVSSSCFPRPA